MRPPRPERKATVMAVSTQASIVLGYALKSPSVAEELITMLNASDSVGGTSTTLGFFGVTPVARVSAYTQTYATADKTHANPTAAALTDSSGVTPSGTLAAQTLPTALTHAVGTADGTVDDVTGSFDQTVLNNNFKELTTAQSANLAQLTVLRNAVASLAAQVNALVADVADAKQLVNSVIDDLQSYGLLQ